MTKIKYLLDTNIVIYTMKNRPAYIYEEFEKRSDSVAISSITVAELYYGAYKSNHINKNLVAINDFISRLPVIDYGVDCSVFYGKIKADLKQKGTIISENDIHIASCALSKNLIVVTNNEREFLRVNNLIVENWFH